MILHQDGPTHEWVSGCQWDLIVTLDDATSAIYSAFFVEEEGTLAVFHGPRCVARYCADGRLIESVTASATADRFDPGIGHSTDRRL